MGKNILCFRHCDFVCNLLGVLYVIFVAFLRRNRAVVSATLTLNHLQTFMMKKLFAMLPLALALAAFKMPEKPAVGPDIPSDVQALLEKHGCTACHAMSKKLVGPMWTDIAAKKYSAKKIVALVKKPEPSNWPGYAPMTPQTTVPSKDLNKIASWLVAMK